MAISMVVGRLVVLAGFLMFLGGPERLPGWLSMQFLPGLPMQAAQVVLVPVIGGMIIRALRRDEGENRA
jgi:predicted Na+-dependent transporter